MIRKVKTIWVFVAGLSFIFALTGCAPTPDPEVEPTLRAADCFDGTVEKGCPSWAMDALAGKTVSHISYTDTLAIMHYTDGTTSDSPRQLSKDTYMNAKEVYDPTPHNTSYDFRFIDSKTGTNHNCALDHSGSSTYICTSE